MAKTQVKMTVNGKAVEGLVEPRTLLVHYLRETLNLTGAHIGCDTTHCGACTVDLDGKSVKSCTMFAVQADGASITTIEGMANADGTLHALQEGFRMMHGLQCGFCTPGMIMRAHRLLQENTSPTEEETAMSPASSNDTPNAAPPPSSSSPAAPSAMPTNVAVSSRTAWSAASKPFSAAGPLGIRCCREHNVIRAAGENCGPEPARLQQREIDAGGGIGCETTGVRHGVNGARGEEELRRHRSDPEEKAAMPANGRSERRGWRAIAEWSVRQGRNAKGRDAPQSAAPCRTGMGDRPEFTGVCGSDWGYYHQLPQTRGPLILGHETVGVIERAGSEARRRWGLEEGDRVALEEYLPCGHCEHCRSGDFRLCEASDWRSGGLRYGATAMSVAPGLWGGYARYLFLHPATVFHRVPDGIAGRHAALALPLSNGIEWAYLQGRAGPGDVVVIQGPGQQGLACVAAARCAAAVTGGAYRRAFPRARPRLRCGIRCTHRSRHRRACRSSSPRSESRRARA